MGILSKLLGPSQEDYTSLLLKYSQVTLKLSQLTDKWNRLVNEVNAKGGEAFLRHGTLQHLPDMSEEDVRRLLQLCHPDKHDNSEASQKATALLLELRKRL